MDNPQETLAIVVAPITIDVTEPVGPNESVNLSHSEPWWVGKTPTEVVAVQLQELKKTAAYYKAEYERLDEDIRSHGGIIIKTIDQMIPLLAAMQKLLSRNSYSRSPKFGLPQWGEYLDGIAEQFGISKRTIQRRLHDLNHPDDEDESGDEDGEGDGEDSGGDEDSGGERRSQFDSEVIADAGIRMAKDAIRNAADTDLSESSRLKRLMAHAEHLMDLVMDKEYDPLPSAKAIKKGDTLLFELQTGVVNDKVVVTPTAFRVISAPDSWDEDATQPYPWSRNSVYRVKGAEPKKRYASIVLEVISE